MGTVTGDAPTTLGVYLRRCLHKDPKQRIHDAGDVRLALEGAFDGMAPSPVAAAPASRRPLMLAWTVAAVATVAAIGLGLLAPGQETPTAPVVRTAVPPPPDTAFDFDFTGGPAVLSPDGRLIAFAARSNGTSAAAQRSQLGSGRWIRPRRASSTAPTAPRSRSGRPTARANGRLQRVDAAGGIPVTITRVGFVRGGSWAPDGTIVFDEGGTIKKVSASGGEPAVIAGQSAGGDNHSPWVLPDGRHFLYLARTRNEVHAASLDGGGDQVVLEATSNAIYASGRLLFMREATLLSQPFDLDCRSITGTPTPVSSDVAVLVGGEARGVFSASETGPLLYQAGGTGAAMSLAWFDADGRRERLIGEVGNGAGIALSQDARAASVGITDGELRTDLWRVDTESGQRTRLTFETDPRSLSPFVAWSPDGRELAHWARRNGEQVLLRRPSTGAGREQVLLNLPATRNQTHRVTGWTRDGSTLVYSGVGFGGISTLALGAAPAGAITALVSDPPGAQNARLSPDELWVAFQAGSADRSLSGIFVEPFPKGGQRQQVAELGTLAVWKRDGKALYYAVDGVLVVRDVSEADGLLRFGPPRPLMLVMTGRGFSYDVANDGRILALVTTEERATRPLTLVQNWLEALAAK